MKIGILAESNHDAVIIMELLIKSAGSFDPPILLDQTSFLEPYEACGIIIPKMRAASAIFFEGNKKADVVVFAVDLDNDSVRRRGKVNDFIRAEVGIDSDRRIVPLFVQPHIEELFFAEGGVAIRDVLLRLPVNQSLPYNDMAKLKDRLKKMIEDFGPQELSVTSKEICQQIARKINVGQLARNSADFGRFRQRLFSTTRLLST